MHKDIMKKTSNLSAKKFKCEPWKKPTLSNQKGFDPERIFATYLKKIGRMALFIASAQKLD